jgi:uncharacterized membrane protein (UPF0127 family)
MMSLLREMIREVLAEADVVTLKINGTPLQVELATTPADHSQGLMHRESLPENRGVLFCYGTDERLSFWMKNTSIPLSIAFISRDGTIKQISDLEPYDESPVSCSSRCRWALEVNRGWFHRNSINVGDAVNFLGQP